MSSDGKNDCHSVSAPCRNLQTVLDRATDGADIYVTSDTLSLDFVIKPYYDRFYGIFEACTINSSLSYTVRSLSNSTIKVTCSHMYIYLLVLFSADSASPLHYSSHEFQGSILDV